MTTPPAVVEVVDGGTTVVVEVPQTPAVIDAVVDAPIEVVEVVTGAVGPPGAPGTIVAVGPTPPPDPTVGDLWVDTS